MILTAKFTSGIYESRSSTNYLRDSTEYWSVHSIALDVTLTPQIPASALMQSIKGMSLSDCVRIYLTLTAQKDVVQFTHGGVGYFPDPQAVTGL